MKIHKSARPWSCASRDTGRYAIEHLNLRVTHDGRGVLEATDGRMLVQVDVELSEGDAPGLVPVGALKDAKPDRAGMREVRANGHVEATTKAGMITMARPEGEFPSCDAVVPTDPGTLCITLNADMLAEIQAAFGSPWVTLRVPMPTEHERDTAWSKARPDGTHDLQAPIYVAPDAGKAVATGRGVLMPVTTG